MTTLTPVEHGHHHHGTPFTAKRDDHYAIGGWLGGKVRTCLAIATRPAGATLFEADTPDGLITASSRHSPQVGIVTAVAHHLGIPARIHVPAANTPSDTLDWARSNGATIHEHRPGYNTVIVARARDDANNNPTWRHVPFGMECPDAVAMTATQVDNLPGGRRLVVPVGSGMTLAGITHGLAHRPTIHYDEIVGIAVGADPTKRIETYATTLPHTTLRVVRPDTDYGTPADVTTTDSGLELDAYYEAKTLPHLVPGDTLWVVGIRTDTSTIGASK